LAPPRLILHSPLGLDYNTTNHRIKKTSKKLKACFKRKEEEDG